MADAQIYSFSTGELVTSSNSAVSNGERAGGSSWDRLHAVIGNRELQAILDADEEGPRLDFPTLFDRTTQRVVVERDGQMLSGIESVIRIVTMAAFFDDRFNYEQLSGMNADELRVHTTGYEISVLSLAWDGARQLWRHRPDAAEMPRKFVRLGVVDRSVGAKALAHDRQITQNTETNVAAIIARAEVLDPDELDTSARAIAFGGVAAVASKIGVFTTVDEFMRAHK